MLLECGEGQGLIKGMIVGGGRLTSGDHLVEQLL